MIEFVLYTPQGSGKGVYFSSAGQVQALVQTLQRGLRQVLQAKRDARVLVDHPTHLFGIDVTGGQGIDAVFEPGNSLAIQFQRIR
ncbi:hypothetical protein D3C80_2064960 [compost metagenome]